MALRAVICDLGGVVVDIDSNRIRQHWARRSRLSSSEVFAAYPDEVYEAFERGEVTEERYLHHVRERLQLVGTDAELADDFNQLYLGVNSAVVELLIQMRGNGLAVLALTNTNSLHHRVWSERFADTLTHFDAIHCSHRLGARKPEAAAFTRVLEAHGLTADEACFIDDVPAYAEAADRVGLAGVTYTDPGSLAQRLTHLGALGTPRDSRWT